MTSLLRLGASLTLMVSLFGCQGWIEEAQQAAGRGRPTPGEPVIEPPSTGCVVGGCSGQLCGPADGPPLTSTCEFRPEYACYQSLGQCEVQADGVCGWTQTDELRACIADAAFDPCAAVLCLEGTVCEVKDGVAECVPVPPSTECVVGGCSGQLCGPADGPPLISTCEFRPEYACYRSLGQCEVQADGVCGWTQTEALAACIDDARGGRGRPTPVEPPLVEVVPEPVSACVVGGCSGQLCGPADGPPLISTCEFLPEYACYQLYGACERQVDGVCGWTQTDQLKECIATAAVNPCVITRCAEGAVCEVRSGIAECVPMVEPPLLVKSNYTGFVMQSDALLETCELYADKVVIRRDFALGYAITETRPVEVSANVADLIAGAKTASVTHEDNFLCDAPSTEIYMGARQPDDVLYSSGGCGSPRLTRVGGEAATLRNMIGSFCPVTH